MNFNQITARKIPFNETEFNTTLANVGANEIPYKGLLFGQATDAGSQAVATKHLITSAAQAALYWGPGSQMHRMAIGFFDNNIVSAVYGIATSVDVLATPTGKAVGTITFTGPATANGAIYFYIAGERIVVAVANEDTAGDIATALAAAINEETSLPVVAAADAGEVGLTAKNVGLAGESIDLRLNYYAGEVLPDGIVATIVAMDNGGADVDIEDAIDAIGNDWFQFIVHPYTGVAENTLLKDELERRNAPNIAKGGFAVTAHNAAYTDMITLCSVQGAGTGLNSEHLTYIASYGSPDFPCEIAARAVGISMHALAMGNGAEGRPQNGLELDGARAPLPADELTDLERDLLLRNGCATLKVGPGGTVLVERMITNYQQDANGGSDEIWLDWAPRLIAMYCRYDWDTYLGKKYPREKLGDDDGNYGVGQIVMTPKLGRAEAMSRFMEWEERAVVKNRDLFKQQLIVEKNIDPVRMDWMMTVQFIGQFMQSATIMAVRR